MGAPVKVTWPGLGPADLRERARREAVPDAVRRLLAIALVLEGASRAEAATAGGMDRQTLRDWVHRYNGTGPDGLSDGRHTAWPPRGRGAGRRLLAAAGRCPGGARQRVHPAAPRPTARS